LVTSTQRDINMYIILICVIDTKINIHAWCKFNKRVGIIIYNFILCAFTYCDFFLRVHFLLSVMNDNNKFNDIYIGIWYTQPESNLCQ